jgi:hypothetical protein
MHRPDMRDMLNLLIEFPGIFLALAMLVCLPCGYVLYLCLRWRRHERLHPATRNQGLAPWRFLKFLTAKVIEHAALVIGSVWT